MKRHCRQKAELRLRLVQEADQHDMGVVMAFPGENLEPLWDKDQSR